MADDHDRSGDDKDVAEKEARARDVGSGAAETLVPSSMARRLDLVVLMGSMGFSLVLVWGSAEFDVGVLAAPRTRKRAGEREGGRIWHLGRFSWVEVMG
jgi:hypothetical protein